VPGLVPLPAQPRGVPWPTQRWPEGSPADRLADGVDGDALSALLDFAFSQPAEMPQTNALLAVHRGRIVVERYGDEMDAATTHVSWSMAKSMLHAVCGLLVEEGRLSLDGPAGVPAWSDPKDPRHGISLRQLLEMRSGLNFLEDYTDKSEVKANVIEMLFGSGQADVAAYASDCPLAHEPGSCFSYSSGTSNIVSSLVSRALGGPDEVDAFVHERLFRPIGMRSPVLRFDDAGTWIGSSFVFATARDFARFGLLYLRGGVWAGARILASDWVDHGRHLSDPAEGETFSYGAHWWVIPGSLGSFQANGFNGQRITVVPGLDLIVVRLGVTPVEFAPRLNGWMKAMVDAFRGSA
jgi:CubicO group peptidase (beta-lactamase class C family)